MSLPNPALGQKTPLASMPALDDLPEKWKHYAELNANYVQSGKFTSGEYTKYAAK